MARARIGFIGAGWWAASNHMPLLAARADVELAAVCRLGASELKQLQQRFGFAYATEDYRQLLRDCELDGVVVASPHTLHFEHARAALDAGLHVMCEKPMTTRSDQARQLVELAAEKGLHLLVPYGWHYKPFVQRAKALMDQGLIGRIEYALCHMASPIRGLLRGEQPDVGDISGQSEPSLFEPEPSTWADPEIAGGGYGHAQVSHAAGMLCWLSGLRATSVYALMSAHEAKVDLYDALSVRFAGGAIGTISGAGNVPTDRPFQVDLRLFGSEGMLLLDCERERMELRRHDGKHQVEEIEAGEGAYDCAGPPTNFVDLVLGQTQENSAPGTAALGAVEILDAAYRSAGSGQAEAV
jgi:predicted dehydrogenase